MKKYLLFLLPPIMATCSFLMIYALAQMTIKLFDVAPDIINSFAAIFAWLLFFVGGIIGVAIVAHGELSK
jgi:hypothetical protein